MTPQEIIHALRNVQDRMEQLQANIGMYSRRSKPEFGEVAKAAKELEGLARAAQVYANFLAGDGPAPTGQGRV